MMKDEFVVIKIEDIWRLLHESESECLLTIIRTIGRRRKELGRRENDYLVVNTDEPYADYVLDCISRGERGWLPPARSDRLGDNQLVFKHLAMTNPIIAKCIASNDGFITINTALEAALVLAEVKGVAIDSVKLSPQP